MELNLDMVDSLKYWIGEREKIRRKKEEGAPKPWTKDVILQQYSFCNVHREDDRVTREIAALWRTPHAENPDLWFWMVVARLLNWPPTLKEFGSYPSAWNAGRKFLQVCAARYARKEQVFNGAYIVSTNGRAMSKPEYLVLEVLDPLWAARKQVRPRAGDTLATFYERLSQFNGLGSFMAGQVIADMKYVAPLKDTADWWTFAVSGPGSRRGLNRVYGRDIDESWRNEGAWFGALAELSVMLRGFQVKVFGERLHNQDLQNCLCEFDKYQRTLTGEGKPKRNYPGV